MGRDTHFAWLRGTSPIHQRDRLGTEALDLWGSSSSAEQNQADDPTRSEQLDAMLATWITLAVLAGFVARGAVESLLTWRSVSRNRSAGYFGFICLAFATNTLLQIASLTTRGLESVGGLPQYQMLASAATLAALVPFGAAIAGRRLDRIDKGLLLGFATLALWSYLNPSDRRLGELHYGVPSLVIGGVFHRASKALEWTVYASLFLSCSLYVRQILDGLRLYRSGERFDGGLWISGMVLSLICGIRDHLVVLGVVRPPYLAVYPFAGLVVVVGIRYTIRHINESVALRGLQRSLSASEGKLRALFDDSSDAVFIHDASDGRIISVNRTATEMYGYTSEECKSLSIADLSAPSYGRAQERVFQHVIESQEQDGSVFLWQAKCKDGSEFPAEVILKHANVSGDSCIVANVRDISERVAQAAALQREQAFVSTLLDNLPGAFCLYDRELRLQRWNRNLEVALGYAAEQLRNMPLANLYPPGPERDDLLSSMRAWLGGAQTSVTSESNVLRADGVLVPHLLKSARLDTHEGPMLMGIGLDISNLVEARAALKESEERYRSLFECAEDAILLLRDNRFIECNLRALHMYGCSEKGQLVGHSPQEFSPELQPDGQSSDVAALSRIVAAAQGEPQHFEWLHCRFDRSTFLAEVSLNLIVLRGVSHLQAIVRDITEKRGLEERLIQAQRLEAIGHLAGGVAHDFNNLLTPILGRVELLLGELGENDPSREDLVEVHAAAERAKRLTRQLLTFGRRAVLEVAPVDLCALLSGMDRLLRGLLREDIQLKLNLGTEEVVVRADPSQLEQVIMNLVVNARDAMPKGGLVSVSVTRQEIDAEFCSTAHACVPGEYAVVSVSDTGLGMSSEVKSRLFEPFFTTKAVGKGTGLGLATVLGIVQQHRGTLSVYSEPGRGSTFKVFLPFSRSATSQAAPAAGEDGQCGGTETILVVEDDDAVRGFACRSLNRFGYQTVAAASPELALAVFVEQEKPPALLLTDVIMPGKNGHELYEQLHQTCAGLRVLYMSGYSGDTISHQGVLDSGVVLLQKPFSVRELLLKVRQVLDAER